MQSSRLEKLEVQQPRAPTRSIRPAPRTVIPLGKRQVSPRGEGRKESGRLVPDLIDFGGGSEEVEDEDGLPRHVTVACAV